MTDKPNREKVIQMILLGAEPKEIMSITGCSKVYISEVKALLGLVDEPLTSFRDIADSLNLNIKTVRNSYKSGMEQMRKHMSMMGVSKECLDVFDDYANYRDWSPDA